MGKLPAFQFYPGDHVKDPGVSTVSLAARGLWMHMLCLMHESPRRGYLQQASGKPMGPDQLARAAGCDASDAQALLRELKDAGVFSCTTDTDACIFSRRMVRDEHKRNACIEAGMRGGNPALKGRDKGPPKGGPKGGITPSAASSSSPSDKDKEPAGKPPEVSTDPAKTRTWTDCFVSEWAKAHKGTKYPFHGGKDGPAVKRIMADLQGDFPKFQRVCRRYFKDADPFVAKNGHGLAFLSSRLATYVADPITPKDDHPLAYVMPYDQAEKLAQQILGSDE